MFGRENVIAGVDCGVGGRCYPDVGWALKALVDGAALASKQSGDS
jgi:5-methyltetrahydropteroyltriglutamate--homocysteine methyltransferase